jgi:hypothetical protein
MPSYLVETYLARSQAGERAACDKRARSAAKGPAVRFDQSIYIPEDEICFFVFDAPSGREAARAAQQAELRPIRVVAALPSRDPATRGEKP